MDKRQQAKEAMTRTEEMQDLKAHQTGNLKHFISKYFLFRAYIVFKNGKRMHLYGNEHQCTYNQLRHGRFQNIELDREKGYGELINLVEKRYRAKYTVAKIYQRKPGEKSFNTVCRHYNSNGELEECQDPVIPEPEKTLTLFYYFKNNLLVITPADPASEDFTINLKKKSAR